MSSAQTIPYPQMPPLTDDEIVAFLKQPLIAKLASFNEDGTIHLAPIWFLYDGGDILLGTQERTRRVRNIKRNSTVTLVVDGTSPALQGVIIYGKAYVEYNDVIPRRIALFDKYMPHENAVMLAEGLAKKWTPVIIRIKPDRMISYDYSKGSLI